jgi:anti-sigma factor RsiW
MSDCKQISELITSYVDGELPDARKDGVERHVAACPPCRSRLVSERSARAALRRCADSIATPLPPGLQSRCESLLSDAASRRTRWRRLRQFGLGAAIAAAAVVLFMVATSHSNAVLAAQLAADHVKCFSVFPPRDWTGIDTGQAEGELAANGWTMKVPATSSANSLRLIGVRGCLTGVGSIPHVLYEANGKPLSLFKLEGARRAESTRVMGRECRIWHRGDSTFVLVAEEDAGPELARVAGYIEQQAR